MRLAIVSSHPIQYYSPWFRYLAAHAGRRSVVSAQWSDCLPLDLRVFYLWNSGVTSRLDEGFAVNVKWDVPLLDGYAHEFVPNIAKRPGPGHTRGLNNPELMHRLVDFNPDAVLLFGYNYITHYRLIFSRFGRTVSLLFRGDSHRLIPEHGLRASFRKLFIQFIFRRFAAFLYVGRANKDYFKLHSVPDDRLFFCPHAVDNERFLAQAEQAEKDAASWRASLDIPTSHRVVLFAGKFEPKKRPRDLVAAFIKARLENATLLLVGSGEQEVALRADVAGRPYVVFAPFQNQTAMPRTYAAGDLFALPSQGRGETWGLAVNEAMCMGRPIVVSDHVGCAQDLVKPGQNGLVFPAGNVPALTDALREAFADMERLKAWGKTSREIVRDYSYENATRGLFRALDFVRPQSSILRSPSSGT